MAGDEVMEENGQHGKISPVIYTLDFSGKEKLNR